ncbi:MAG TPA: hypothetical protein EYP41_09600 [Anaerolineae bacterium]|nr:hypothetical protein [Anaerolineae bacterium]
MLNLYRAELLKIVGNRWVTGFTLWIFPVGALGAVLFVALLALAVDDFAAQFFREPPLWTSAMISAWNFPTNILGQMFLMGLTAVTFAGEYQWGTWKNIIPRRRRTALILIKFLALGTLVLFTFVLMSLILGLGYGLIAQIGGVPYGPAITRTTLAEFARDYSFQAFVTFLTVLITAIYAAFAAMLTRSILGGVMVGLGIVVVEPISTFLLAPVAFHFDWTFLLTIMRLTPTYNINNVTSWVTQNMPNPTIAFYYEAQGLPPPADSLGFSLLVLTGWVVLGIGLILWLFQRQDINS